MLVIFNSFLKDGYDIQFLFCLNIFTYQPLFPSTNVCFVKEEQAKSIPFLKFCIAALHRHYKFHTMNVLDSNHNSNK